MARPREFDIDEALEAALQAFWEHGYEATSMADLMEAMQLQKGSIYKAFGDKHRLFMRALDRYLDQAQRVLRDVLSRAESPLEGVKAWLQRMVRPLCCEQKSPRGCFALNAVVELGPHDPEVAARVSRHRERIEQTLAEAIAAGQQQGQFRDDLPAEQLAEVLMVFVSGMLANSKGGPCPQRTQRLTDFALRLVSP